jgi:NADH-quinone oxidoreductase subunit G
MCLVEMERAPKPIASCAMPAADGMVIKTNTETVRKARNGVMEFLLVNHPLDCPICDQGGECDLQDQAMAYGYDRSRYAENKRAVKEKYMGPLIKTIMTRCIQCTRCVRFATEVAGVEEIGLVNRGEHAEITTLEKAVNSELSGNLIDVCPVGALTSRPYAFAARPWELRKTLSIDVMDAVGSNIRIDCRGREVLRVLPRLHEAVNEEWIADKSRYACDGLKRQRLDRPYLRRDGRLVPVTWDEALAAVADKLKILPGSKVAALAGDQADAESIFALKELMTSLSSSNLDCRQDGAKLDPGCRGAYLFNTSIARIEEADAILIVGSNPRWEAPLVNARIRKRFLRGGLKIGLIGQPVDLSYDYEHLGDSPSALETLAHGGGGFADTLKAAKNPMIILGMGALTREDGSAVLGAARRAAADLSMLRDDWNGFNVLHTAASRVGALDLGFLPGAGGKDLSGILAGAGKGEIDLIYLLGADEIDMAALGKPGEGAFVVYQGHHGDKGAHRADVILPGAAYSEKNGTYVNLEGRVQTARRAAFPPGDAREDWTIIRALSGALGKPLPFDNLGELRQKMIASCPNFAAADQVAPGEWGEFGTEAALGAEPFGLAIENYYMTDPISRASETMAACTQAFLRGDQEQEEATGTHG